MKQLDITYWKYQYTTSIGEVYYGEGNWFCYFWYDDESYRINSRRGIIGNDLNFILIIIRNEVK
jgi:hypothetical protein